MSVIGSAARMTVRMPAPGSLHPRTHEVIEDAAVGEEERGIEAHDHDARDPLPLGVAREVVIAADSRHPSEFGAVRPPRLVHEREEREPDRHEDAREHAEHEHADEGRE